MSDTTWYERLAAIAELEYASPRHIRRPEMPERFFKPQRVAFTFEGKRRESLDWPTESGGTSASPAHRWGLDTDPRNLSPALILQRLYEKLELPGVASDYHFALLSAYQALALHARRNPELLAELERLCLLDIALIERLPHIVRTEFDPTTPLHVPAYWLLIKLYERNGLLEDALTIARRAAAAGYGMGETERLEERLSALRAEDA